MIAFLDDDDLYAPEHLTRALDVLDRNADLDGLFMGVSWFGAAGDWASADYERAMRRALDLADGTQREPGLLVFGPGLFGMLLQTVPMAFQRPVVRRAALDEIGLYEPGCLLWDCDWAIRAAAAHRFGLLIEPPYRQRVHGLGTSSRADRALDHLLSGVEIKERLYANAERYSLTDAQRHAVRDSAASAWFTLAYFQCTQRHDSIAAPLGVVSEPEATHLGATCPVSGKDLRDPFPTRACALSRRARTPQLDVSRDPPAPGLAQRRSPRHERA